VKREPYGIVCAGVVATVAVGFSASASALPSQPLVPQGKLSSIVLTKDTIDSIIGATMTSDTSYVLPPDPANVDKPGCSVIFGLDSKTLSGDYQAYKFNKMSDGNDQKGYDHLVFQGAAIYGTTEEPTKLFLDAFQSVRNCAGALHNSDDNTDWQVQPPTVIGGRAHWISSQLQQGQPAGWRCAHDVRLHANVLLEDTVCQYGNPATVASQIVDQMIAGASA
jgi:PknH-like protein